MKQFKEFAACTHILLYQTYMFFFGIQIKISYLKAEFLTFLKNMYILKNWGARPR